MNSQAGLSIHLIEIIIYNKPIINNGTQDGFLQKYKSKKGLEI
jgi:hypothetical protein